MQVILQCIIYDVFPQYFSFVDNEKKFSLSDYSYEFGIKYGLTRVDVNFGSMYLYGVT